MRVKNFKRFIILTGIYSGLFFTPVFIFVISEVKAAAAGGGLQIGAGLMKFDYAEYDDNNVFLDAERGMIPGIILTLNHDNGRTYTEWVNRLYYNKITYDGQTQSGTPLMTVSDALIIDSHIKYGQILRKAYGREQSMYAGLGYRYWFRNILPGYDNKGNAVAGILEEYSWFYSLIGYTVKFKATDTTQVGFDFRLTQMYNAKMGINFLGYKNYDNTSVNLGGKMGARLAMPIEIKMQDDSFFITPYVEIIDIGKSNAVQVYSGGVATGTVIYEPRSETRNMGVEFIWNW